jgi:hypothetical protein
MRRVPAIGALVIVLLAGGLAGVLVFGPPPTQAAAPREAAASVAGLGHCPKDARALPAEAVARAADQARIEAPQLYPGRGRAVVTQSDLAPYATARGSEVKHQCGARTFHQTVVVDLLFPKELPSASLSQGTVFVSLFATGYQVWEVAH